MNMNDDELNVIVSTAGPRPGVVVDTMISTV